MNWKSLLKPLAVQSLGQAILGALAWYWLGVGVGSSAMVALNLMLGLLWIGGQSWLWAFGLGIAGRAWRVVPALVLVLLMGLHIGAMLIIPLLLVIVVLPSAVVGRVKGMIGAEYVGKCLAALLVMVGLPSLLLNWVPVAGGLSGQLVSFGIRAGVSFVAFAGGLSWLLGYIGDAVRGTDGVAGTGN